jgi:hypothetical protein
MMCIGWKTSGCKQIPLDGGCSTQSWFWVALAAVVLLTKKKGGNGGSTQTAGA